MTNESIPMAANIDIFPWNKNFETGIEIIDQQHKKLLELVNALAKHFVNQSNPLTLNTILDELTAYTVYHFETEEAIWHQYFANDELEREHHATHGKFIEEVLALKNQNSTLNAEQVIENVLSFLTQWLAFHILDNDKRMAKVVFALQNGVPLEIAKHQSESEMTGAMKILISTVLSMYDSICNRTVQLMREIIERQKIEAKQRLASNVFENTLDAICITDNALKIIEVNPTFCRAKKLTANKIIGQNLPELKIAFKNAALFEEVWFAIRKIGHWSGEIYPDVKTKNNIEWLTLSAVKNESGDVTNYVAVFSNVANLLELKRDLEHHAYHDALTGLPNRTLLTDRLTQALLRTERHRNTLAICYLDLDGFKAVNDTFGHAAGDLLLKEIAQRFSKLLRATDTVARLGGDEFVILFGDLAKPDDYKLLLDKVCHAVNQPILLGKNGDVGNVSVSIGVTFYPSDECSAQELLEHADLAMYHAKEAGKSQYKIFTKELLK
jgi:diguanylate cyclase (GGDEF)-like protein/hemerythrin-like metal-binding protein/PAS domain S-box-containing protein